MELVFSVSNIRSIYLKWGEEINQSIKRLGWNKIYLSKKSGVERTTITLCLGGGLSSAGKPALTNHRLMSLLRLRRACGLKTDIVVGGYTKSLYDADTVKWLQDEVIKFMIESKSPNWVLASQLDMKSSIISNLLKRPGTHLTLSRSLICYSGWIEEIKL